MYIPLLFPYKLCYCFLFAFESYLLFFSLGYKTVDGLLQKMFEADLSKEDLDEEDESPNITNPVFGSV